MNVESYTSRILSLYDRGYIVKKSPDKKPQKKFQVKNGHLAIIILQVLKTLK